MMLKLHYESFMSVTTAVTGMKDSHCSLSTIFLLIYGKSCSGSEKNNCIVFQSRGAYNTRISRESEIEKKCLDGLKCLNKKCL